MKNDGQQQEHRSEEKPDDDSQWVRSLGYFSMIVGDLLGFTGAGVGIGYLIAKKWNTSWWVVLVTSLAGLTVSMYRVYLLNQRDMN